MRSKTSADLTVGIWKYNNEILKPYINKKASHLCKAFHWWEILGSSGCPPVWNTGCSEPENLISNKLLNSFSAFPGLHFSFPFISQFFGFKFFFITDNPITYSSCKPRMIWIMLSKSFLYRSPCITDIICILSNRIQNVKKKHVKI